MSYPPRLPHPHNDLRPPVAAQQPPVTPATAPVTTAELGSPAAPARRSDQDASGSDMLEQPNSTLTDFVPSDPSHSCSLGAAAADAARIAESSLSASATTTPRKADIPQAGSRGLGPARSVIVSSDEESEVPEEESEDSRNQKVHDTIFRLLREDGTHALQIDGWDSWDKLKDICRAVNACWSDKSSCEGLDTCVINFPGRTQPPAVRKLYVAMRSDPQHARTRFEGWRSARQEEGCLMHTLSLQALRWHTGVCIVRTHHGTGRGFLFGNRGHVVTNSHLVQSSKDVETAEFDFGGKYVFRGAQRVMAGYKFTAPDTSEVPDVVVVKLGTQTDDLLSKLDSAFAAEQHLLSGLYRIAWHESCFADVPTGTDDATEPTCIVWGSEFPSAPNVKPAAEPMADASFIRAMRSSSPLVRDGMLSPMFEDESDFRGFSGTPVVDGRGCLRGIIYRRQLEASNTEAASPSSDAAASTSSDSPTDPCRRLLLGYATIESVLQIFIELHLAITGALRVSNKGQLEDFILAHPELTMSVPKIITDVLCMKETPVAEFRAIPWASIGFTSADAALRAVQDAEDDFIPNPHCVWWNNRDGSEEQPGHVQFRVVFRVPEDRLKGEHVQFLQFLEHRAFPERRSTSKMSASPFTHTENDIKQYKVLLPPPHKLPLVHAPAAAASASAAAAASAPAAAAGHSSSTSAATTIHDNVQPTAASLAPTTFMFVSVHVHCCPPAAGKLLQPHGFNFRHVSPKAAEYWNTDWLSPDWTKLEHDFPGSSKHDEADIRRACCGERKPDRKAQLTKQQVAVVHKVWDCCMQPRFLAGVNYDLFVAATRAGLQFRAVYAHVLESFATTWPSPMRVSDPERFADAVHSALSSHVLRPTGERATPKRHWHLNDAVSNAQHLRTSTELAGAKMSDDKCFRVHAP